MCIRDWSSDVFSSDLLFTDLPLDEIARLESLHGVEINEAKIVLANEATAMCRGREAAEAAAETARQTFALGGAGADLTTLQVPEGEIGIIAEVGRASCRSRVCQYGEFSGVGGSIKNKTNNRNS